MQAVRLGEFLYGIAEHGAGHGSATRLQPCFKGGRITLAGFTQKPTYSLVYEVMFVVKQYFCYGVCISCLAVADKLHGAYNSNALFPNGLSVTSQIIE